MADLSQYVDFTFKIDNSGSTPVCVLTDISLYPEGASAFQGFIKIVQPDGIAISPDFSTPDVIYSALASTKPYRLASDGSLQNGNYTIVYTVKCAGYDDTVVTRTFSLGYSRIPLVITPLIDVFTPSIRVQDGTAFTQTGLTLSGATYNWSVIINNAGNTTQTITGTSKILDLVYNGNYYDSAYVATLTDIVTYTLSAYSWITIIDKITSTQTFDAYAPMTISALQAAINALTPQDCGCSGETIVNSAVQSMLYEMNLSGLLGNTIGLQVTELAIEKILYPYTAKTHTGYTIGAYAFMQTVTYTTQWGAFNW